MSENPNQTPIRDRYVSQISEDLERNRRQQGELKSQLEVLHAEETWLSDVLSLSGDKPESNRPAVVAQSGPASDREESNHAPQSQRARKRGAHPPLGGVIWQVLSTHDEPQTVTAVHREVTGLHPEREVSQQVVRNALEALVAKGRVARLKDQRSVTYTQSLSADGTADDARTA